METETDGGRMTNPASYEPVAASTAASDALFVLLGGAL